MSALVVCGISFEWILLSAYTSPVFYCTHCERTRRHGHVDIFPRTFFLSFSLLFQLANCFKSQTQLNMFMYSIKEKETDKNENWAKEWQQQWQYQQKTISRWHSAIRFTQLNNERTHDVENRRLAHLHASIRWSFHLLSLTMRVRVLLLAVPNSEQKRKM